ncbi:MAG: hypothetical protein EB100_07200, partial [Crocinitomicaceae bacterium]|nr:hypothetical protein [Crocinitomicaceae bacterium]
ISPYFATVQSNFSVLENTKLFPIKKWVKEVGMLPEKYKTKTLFYPLAGADFVYADAFFNDVDNYIMVGLEKPGFLPNYTSFTNAQIESYISSVYNSLDVSMKFGYFKTINMRVQFNQKVVNGTIHSLLFYLARTGKKISEVKHFQVQNDGSVKYTFGAEAMKSAGVEILFQNERGETKKLHYYSTDLSDANKSLDAFYKWVSSFGTHNTMLKAASYLNSREYFTKTRNYILNSSQLIVQDDSGIPFKFVSNPSWDVKLYGAYKKVIPLFASRIQPDLVQAYADSTKLTSKVLPFKIGYNVMFNETNLQLFYKKSYCSGMFCV